MRATLRSSRGRRRPGGSDERRGEGEKSETKAHERSSGPLGGAVGRLGAARTRVTPCMSLALDRSREQGCSRSEAMLSFSRADWASADLPSRRSAVSSAD